MAKDFTDAIKRFRNFNSILSHELTVNNKAEADKYRGIARRAAPMKTGLLRQGIVSLQVSDTDRKKVWSIISKRPAGGRSPYNIFQEMGVKPFDTKHGWRHPGIKAKEFMLNTYLVMAKQIPKKTEDTVRLAVYKAFS